VILENLGSNCVSVFPILKEKGHVTDIMLTSKDGSMGEN
jgi:hypothetical protein